MRSTRPAEAVAQLCVRPFACTMTNKRFLLIAIGAVVLVGVALLLAPSGTRGYRAASMVITKPYTNAFFPRSFESHVVQTIPGVLSLSVVPTFSAIPGSGAPLLTNGVGIRIVAVGLTPEEAQLAANEAARRICQMVSTNYGVTGQIVAQASSARSYSYFHDSFQPAIGRLFKH